MCGRYWIESTEGWEKIFHALRRLPTPEKAKSAGEIFPGDFVPVIANNKKQEPSVFWMQWGLQTIQGTMIINARSETASLKPMFQESMQYRRCLIPASHYFEWEHQGKEKVRYVIQPGEGEMMYMAALYRMEGNQPVFVILTREAESEIRFIHHRMPVMLPESACRDWLDPQISHKELLQKAVLSTTHHKALPT